MDKRMIIDNGSGGVKVVIPAPEMFDTNSKTRVMLRSKGIDFKTEEEIWSYIKTRAGVDLATPLVDKSVVPRDRAFRNAWERSGETIIINKDKAVDIQTDKLRERRKDVLGKLDATYLIADEKGDVSEKQRIAGIKQELRDLPVDKRAEMMAMSLAQLKDYVPTVITDNE